MKQQPIVFVNRTISPVAVRNFFTHPRIVVYICICIPQSKTLYFAVLLINLLFIDILYVLVVCAQPGEHQTIQLQNG